MELLCDNAGVLLFGTIEESSTGDRRTTPWPATPSR